MKILILTKLIVNLVFITSPGLTMINQVINRGDDVILTCDEADSSHLFPSSSSPSSSSPSSSSLPRSSSSPSSSSSPPSLPRSSSSPPARQRIEQIRKFSWFVKPCNHTRDILTNCKQVRSKYSEIFQIKPQIVEGDLEQSGCTIASINGSSLPAGTYECLKIEHDQIRIRSELIIIESEPNCKIELKREDGKTKSLFSFNNGADNSNNTHQLSIIDGSIIKVTCEIMYSGHLTPTLNLTTNDLPSPIDNYKYIINYNNGHRDFQASFDFVVSFHGGRQLISIGVKAEFHVENGSHGDVRVLSNVPVYDMHLPLVLLAGVSTSSLDLFTSHVVQDERSRPPILDDKTLIIIMTLIAMLLFLVFGFSFCYFQMNKKIRDIQSLSNNVSGGSVPGFLREERQLSLYDEINPDEETPGFFHPCEVYMALDQSTMAKNKIIGGDDDDVAKNGSKLNAYSRLNIADTKVGHRGSTKSTTRYQPCTSQGVSNVYLDLISSFEKDQSNNQYHSNVGQGQPGQPEVRRQQADSLELFKKDGPILEKAEHNSYLVVLPSPERSPSPLSGDKNGDHNGGKSGDKNGDKSGDKHGDKNCDNLYSNT